MMQAQQNWCVDYQKTSLLKKVSEDKEKNNVTITKSSLEKSGELVITFNLPDKSITRTVMADNIDGSGIESWEMVKKKLSVQVAVLKKMMADKEQIEFYMTEIPSDPEKAAVVRVRKIHLFTLRVK